MAAHHTARCILSDARRHPLERLAAGRNVGRIVNPTPSEWQFCLESRAVFSCLKSYNQEKSSLGELYLVCKSFIGHNEGTDHGADQCTPKEKIAGAHRG